MEINSLVEKIMSTLRTQSVLRSQLEALQREYNDLINKVNRNNGKTEGLLELYKEITGIDFNEAINKDPELAAKIEEINRAGMAIAQGPRAIPAPEPKLKSEVSNRKLPVAEKTEMEVPGDSVVLRTKNPPKIVVKDETKQAVKEDDDE